VSSSIPEYFALFGLEPRFAIDLARLSRAYREVLSQVHPDRHAGAGAGERRAAMQLASHANEAYEVLKSDCARAAYLCRSRGTAIEGADAAPLAPAFLEQQMHWREALEAAREGNDAGAVAALARTVAGQRTELVARLARLLDATGDTAAAAAAVRALMFVEKLLAEIDRYGADRDETMTAGR
jgi:molecular chaperone HscB